MAYSKKVQFFSPVSCIPQTFFSLAQTKSCLATALAVIRSRKTLVCLEIIAFWKDKVVCSLVPVLRLPFPTWQAHLGRQTFRQFRSLADPDSMAISEELTKQLAVWPKRGAPPEEIQGSFQIIIWIFLLLSGHSSPRWRVRSEIGIATSK